MREEEGEWRGDMGECVGGEVWESRKRRENERGGGGKEGSIPQIKTSSQIVKRELHLKSCYTLQYLLCNTTNRLRVPGRLCPWHFLYINNILYNQNIKLKTGTTNSKQKKKKTNFTSVMYKIYLYVSKYQNKKI